MLKEKSLVFLPARLRALLLILLCAFLSAGCADREDPGPETKSEVRPEKDESTFYEDNTVYHMGVPSELAFVIPRVPDPVSREVFSEYVAIASTGSSADCIVRTDIRGGKTVRIGLFYPEEDSSLKKVCTKEDCREDPDLPCEHLLPILDEIAGGAVRYEDCVYFTAEFHEQNRTWFGVLEWKIGARDFDKLFESEDPIFALRAVDGILYIRTAPNNYEESEYWYAVRMDREIAVKIPVPKGQILLFGAHGIVCADSRGQGSVTLLDMLLQPERTVLGRMTFGAVAGGYFWYTENGSLWRVSTEKRDRSEKILDGVSDFGVSEKYLWTVSGETGELRRAEWQRNGTLSKETLLFAPKGEERLEAFARDEINGQKPLRGDLFLWMTLSPGDGLSGGQVRTGYLSGERKTMAVLRAADSGSGG